MGTGNPQTGGERSAVPRGTKKRPATGAAMGSAIADKEVMNAYDRLSAAMEKAKAKRGN